MAVVRWLATTCLALALFVAQGRAGQPEFLEVTYRSDPHGAHHDETPHDEKPIITHGKPHEKDVGEHVQDHVDEHADDHAEHIDEKHSGGDCPGQQSANSVAVGLLAAVVLTPTLVYMSMSKAAGGAVSQLTFKLVDLSTSIFLAVLWFSATTEVLETELIKHAFPYAEEVFAILQVFILYALAMAIAFYCRENKYNLLTFCGCAGHYIAFAGIKATGESQHIVQKYLPEDYKVYASIGFCFVVLLVFTILSVICFFAWRKNVKHDEFNMAIEEIEYDIVGLVLSFAMMQAFRHVLTGRYPPEAHMFLQDGGVTACGLDHHYEHNATQRALMLAWSVALTIIAMVCLQPMEDLKARSSYWTHKAVHVLQVVLVMCAAWGYLLWGEWQFYQTIFRGDKMFGKMMFAIMATVVCLMFTIGLAFATHERFSNARGYADLVIMAISLVAAWSWEHCFHTALNVVAAEYDVGYGGLVPKIVIAMCIPLIILPGYVVFLKPIVVENEEAAKEEETLLYIQKSQDASSWTLRETLRGRSSTEPLSATPREGDEPPRKAIGLKHSETSIN